MGVHKVTDVKGEDHLSVFERGLWDLTYSCLALHQCPVIFNVYGPMAQHRIDQQITFFVPRQNPKADTVKQYLQQELAHHVRAGEVIKRDGFPDEYFFGVSITIMEFDGTDLYMDRAKTEQMARAWAASFKDKIDALREGNNNVKH